MPATAFCIVLTTAPSEAEADTLARQIVQARLGACVQVQAIKSFYTWQGEAHSEPEWRLSIKTTRDQFPALDAFIRASHSYAVPEVVQVAIEAGSADYLAWVASQVAA